MSNENAPKKETFSAKLKSAFQSVSGGLYAVIGEDPNTGIQTAGYVYERASLAKAQAVQKFKTAFGT
jgi:hypothetical protein